MDTDVNAEGCILKTRPLSDGVGCEVLDVDLAQCGEEEFAAVEAAFARHGALLFRDQSLHQDALVGFSKRFGALDLAPLTQTGRLSVEGYPEIYVISNLTDGAGKAIGALGNGEAIWHTDMSYLETPPMASLLYAREVPPQGGNTHVCSMIAAYRALPEDLKTRAASFRIKHDATYNSGGYVREGLMESDDPRETTGTFHPAVIRHPSSGEPALYLGRRRHAYVEGLDLPESEALLDALWAYATLAENSYEHVWRVGDVLLWDNRITMHRRDSFDPGHRRLMWRTQMQGASMPERYLHG